MGALRVAASCFQFLAAFHPAVFSQMIVGTPPVLDILRKSIKFLNLGIRTSSVWDSDVPKSNSPRCAQFCAHHETLLSATENRKAEANAF